MSYLILNRCVGWGFKKIWWKILEHMDSRNHLRKIQLLILIVSSSGRERLFSPFRLISPKVRNC